MDEKTFLGLAPGFFAQQPGQQGKVEYRQPKAEELTEDAQNMIDAFSDANIQNWNNMAALIEAGKYLEVGKMLATLTQEWKQQIV